MPPHLPRKRLRSLSPVDDGRTAKKAGPSKSRGPVPRKSTVSDGLAAGPRTRSAEKGKCLLSKTYDEADSSSLSSLSDVEFEDVPAPKRQQLDEKSGSEDEEEDEDVEFEDVPSHQERQADPVVSGDLELTLYQDTQAPLATDGVRKGPSKKQKQIRHATHCIHVQFLLWHNAIRNSWLCDQEVQAIMISHLTPRLWEAVDRWRRASGLDDRPNSTPKGTTTTRGREKGTGKGKTKGNKLAVSQPERDWGDGAERLEKGAPDMSHGDPLFRLMKSISSWWRQKFQVTAPGLRKYGYMDARRLGKWRESFESGQHEPEKHGERIASLQDFRRHAQECSGSRDVGAHLFTALLRGLGLEARLVANLQCLGFGFTKNEEADEARPVASGQTNGAEAASTSSRKKAPSAPPKKMAPKRPARRGRRKGDADALRMDLSESDEFGEPLSDQSEDDSAIDVTGQHQPKATQKQYDQDLEYPHYWTEVLSPVTQKYIPVEPIVKSVIGTSREMIECLEPRGGRADKAKQIMAYVVGYSQDGTAKDVTVRYLRNRFFPGRTKGVRLPVEKVAIHNTHGKVTRYDQSDWFKSVMRGYARGGKMQPITDVDEAEDQTDLQPAVPEVKEVKEGEETLQHYKSSKEYVLARHLKREEALLPSAKAVKVFRNKVKGGKVEDEDVYLRKDVVAVKSAETWHKQGRAPKSGEVPLKHAPYRAATTNRRRELAEAEARTGAKVLQPLYSIEQTDWIIPPPIENGVVPKNEYGNIDMFVPDKMCPKGAVHLPYRGTARVCKRLQIDYAEAVVGFEFGHRMAVPVIQGVVVAQEHQDRVLDELEKDEAERARKEDEKRTKAALGMWRKLLMGLRIADRIKNDYGHIRDGPDSLPMRRQAGGDEDDRDDDDDLNAMRDKDEDMAGGFLPDGYEEEEHGPSRTSAYFPLARGGKDDDHDTLHIEGAVQRTFGAEAVDDAPAAEPEPAPEPDDEAAAPPKPMRRRAAKPKPKAKSKAKKVVPDGRRRRRRKAVSSEEEDDEEEEEEEEENEDEFIPSD